MSFKLIYDKLIYIVYKTIKHTTYRVGGIKLLKVEKRNGMIVDFEGEKIVNAVSKAMAETEIGVDKKIAKEIADNAYKHFSNLEVADIEKIQDFVEIELMKTRPDVAKKYILYRDERARQIGRASCRERV